MKASARERKYAEQNFGEVHHTTLDPEGPGVVRIHLIPPVLKDGQISSGTAILNGQDIVPVNSSWSILLIEFIKEVNKYSGREIDGEDARKIVEATAASVRKVYPFISKKRLADDIYTIMNTFRQVAYGEEPDEGIEYMSIGEYAPYMRAPHRMDLCVSAMTKDGAWHCNQNCVHCYAAGQSHSAEEELGTEDWKKIIDKCRQACIPQLTFTGGEPTMREDLVELIGYSAWFMTRLNTNGIRLTPEYCKELKKASLDSVQITFYSCDEQIHNALVGADRYRDTVAGIDNALAEGLNISINTPLCTLNRDYRGTLKFLHEKGVRYVTCSGLITTGKAAGQASERLQLTNAEVREILEDAVPYAFSLGMEISFTSPGWVSDELCRELGINTPNCGACLSNMAVTPGGNAVPCQSWLSGASLGSMLTDSWESIWNCEESKKRREYSAQMRCDCPLRIIRREEGGRS
ncbi:MAG: radical SAM protein [Lachnospiraceae bacterium]|nr:radical SAM protein [Lachnospiraceae bacterium]